MPDADALNAEGVRALIAEIESMGEGVTHAEAVALLVRSAAALSAVSAERDRFAVEAATGYDVGFRDGQAWPKETADEWEYGIKGLHSEPGPIGRDEAQAREAAWNWGQPYYRRRPSSPWEPVPLTPEEADTAHECSNDRHHGYNTGYCTDCAKEAAHGG